jgi:WD40 repeat protein
VIASASDGEDAVRIWDAKSGQVRYRVPLTDVRKLALADFVELAAIGRNTAGKESGVWICTRESRKAPILLPDTQDARCLKFEGRWLWIGQRDKITLWDCWDAKSNEMNETMSYKFERPTSVNALAVVDHSPYLVAAATSNGVLLIDAGKMLDSASTTSRLPATCVAFSRDGKSVAVGGEGGCVCAWSIIDRKLVKRFEVRLHRNPVTSIAYSDNGKALISVCHNGEISRCDAETGDFLSRTRASGAPPVGAKADTTPALVLFADGKRLVGRFGLKSEENHPQLHLWNTRSHRVIRSLQR